MTKNELIKKLAYNFPDLQVSDVYLAVDTILEDMRATLESGERIEIRGFGSFTVRYFLLTKEETHEQLKPFR